MGLMLEIFRLTHVFFISTPSDGLCARLANLNAHAGVLVLDIFVESD
jgi:hypothetical protein